MGNPVHAAASPTHLSVLWLAAFSPGYISTLSTDGVEPGKEEERSAGGFVFKMSFFFFGWVGGWVVGYLDSLACCRVLVLLPPVPGLVVVGEGEGVGAVGGGAVAAGGDAVATHGN